MGLYNKDYWLSYRDSDRYNVRFNSTFQIQDEKSLNLLCHFCNETTISGMFSKYNLGELILGAYMYPINPERISNHLYYDSIQIGNTTFGGGGQKIFNRNIPPMLIFDMGSMFYKVDSYLELNDFTTVKVYLPFYGYIDLNPNDFANKWLAFRLSVNFPTGEGTYYVCVCDKEPPKYTTTPVDSMPQANVDHKYVKRVIQTVQFILGVQVPTSSSNANEHARNALLGTLKTGLGVASAIFMPSTVATTVSAVTSTSVTPRVTKTRNPNTNRLNTAYKDSGYSSTVTEQSTRETTTAEHPLEIASQTFEKSLRALSKIPYSISCEQVKNVSGLFFASTHIHVLKLTPKIKPQPQKFNHLFGKPLGETRKLSTLRGYTVMSKVHFDTPYLNSATEEEKMMLKSKLLEGVYL